MRSMGPGGGCAFCTSVSREGRTLKETENFYVVPSLGSLVPGYLLIVSKAHFLSVSEMLYCEPKLAEEFVDLKCLIGKRLSQVYDETVFFEHGAVSQVQRSGCCIDHLHVHCVPLGRAVSDRVLGTLQRELEGTKTTRVSRLGEQFRMKRPYLYYETPREAFSFVANRVPSQFVRMLIAKEIGLGPLEWDWKMFPRHEMVGRCMSELEL